MFEQSLLRTAEKGRKYGALTVSFLVESAIVCALLVAPLLYTAELSVMPSVIQLIAPSPRKAVPDPEPVIRTRRVSSPRFSSTLTVPVRIPNRIVTIDDGEAPELITTAIIGNGPFLPPELGRAETARYTPPPEPPKREAPNPPPMARQRVGGEVQAAKLITRVMPAYPEMAKRTRITGVVRLQAVIGRDGRVEQLQVISGHPFLVPVALEAVRQWVYRPTLLNGDPVEVLTTIDVNFTLRN